MSERKLPTPKRHEFPRGAGKLIALSAGAITLGALAVYNRAKASQAERAHPPKGKFITVRGVRLHYLERGSGEPLVMLHGNGSSTDELLASGLITRAAQQFRVIAFDRPGFGYSERPSRIRWTARAQARLLADALSQLGVGPAVVFGHSWGTLVALNLAVDHPAFVRSLVLASGYYFPTRRADAVLFSPPAIPLIGTVLANTISPIAARVMWESLVRRMFWPAHVPEKFRAYSKELAVRPGQLQAAAEESALMIGEAAAIQQRYQDLDQTVVLLSGDGDQIVDMRRQSERLHALLPSSRLDVLARTGHMTHETSVGAVMSAIRRAAAVRSCELQSAYEEAST